MPKFDKRDYDPNDDVERDEQAEFEIYNEDGRYIGDILVDCVDPDNIQEQEMPTELEINGIMYYPQF